MANASTATSCRADVKFIQKTQKRRIMVLVIPTKADMKQSNDIAIEPNIIQEFKDHRLSIKGATENLNIHGKLSRRLSPTFDRENFSCRRSNGSSLTWKPYGKP